jgi:hypothetical protein
MSIIHTNLPRIQANHCTKSVSSVAVTFLEQWADPVHDVGYLKNTQASPGIERMIGNLWEMQNCKRKTIGDILYLLEVSKSLSYWWPDVVTLYILTKKSSNLTQMGRFPHRPQWAMNETGSHQRKIHQFCWQRAECKKMFIEYLIIQEE